MFRSSLGATSALPLTGSVVVDLRAMEHVIVSPHNSAASQGNEGRAFAMFTANLARWLRGQALEQEVGER